MNAIQLHVMHRLRSQGVEGLGAYPPPAGTLLPGTDCKFDASMGWYVCSDLTTISDETDYWTDGADSGNPPPSAQPGGGPTTVNQLKDAIAASERGYITAAKNSTPYIIASENWLWFSVAFDPLNPSQYRITKSWTIWYLVGGAAALLLTGGLGGARLAR